MLRNTRSPERAGPDPAARQVEALRLLVRQQQSETLDACREAEDARAQAAVLFSCMTTVAARIVADDAEEGEAFARALADRDWARVHDMFVSWVDDC